MGCCGCLSDIILVVISVLFPPLPVWIRRGLCSCDSLINILLCFLGYFPGLIHSWYIIAKYPPYSLESKVYYVYSGDLESQTPRHCHHHHHHHQSDNDSQRVISDQVSATSAPAMTYGSINDVEEGSSSKPIAAPPAYTEIDRK
ncbi:uncharacterized protein PRCAT00005486001 [Priceomyces carsonii]|uniref:uncharacterized protein n=1 Tax=Priceomyces carsonii TaxID=28549 RepID=UPI002EDA714D|nr:unnamed protein product [Priceomyces carsonii]